MKVKGGIEDRKMEEGKNVGEIIRKGKILHLLFSCFFFHFRVAQSSMMQYQQIQPTQLGYDCF
jgi:hypothetical protein